MNLGRQYSRTLNIEDASSLIQGQKQKSSNNDIKQMSTEKLYKSYLYIGNKKMKPLSTEKSYQSYLYIILSSFTADGSIIKPTVSLAYFLHHL